ncbi:MAG: hypothetical protein JNJ54_04515 [Myxococcaceae bacterium]|nr:hypothetical protein [Myxococcaceae bacterium]
MADAITIFYSWQSDLPNRTNRGFIRDALEAAARKVRQDGSLSVDARIDSDTQGIAGSPEIHSAIFAKIDAAQCAVFDVSIVRRDSLLKILLGRRRAHPNPNVLVELGYALKSMGDERVLTVLNLDTGGPEDLPFDIRQKRIITYSVRQSKPSDVRAALAKKLDEAIRSVLALGPRTSDGASEAERLRREEVDHQAWATAAIASLRAGPGNGLNVAAADEPHARWAIRHGMLTGMEWKSGLQVSLRQGPFSGGVEREDE